MLSFLYYHKVKEITAGQIALVKAYKSAWNSVQRDGHFTPEEIKYIGSVYTGIIEESLKNLEQVALVINSFSFYRQSMGEKFGRTITKVCGKT